MKVYRERRVDFFTCDGCGKRAQSYKRSRAKREKCKPCRLYKVDDRQLSLLGCDPGVPGGDKTCFIEGYQEPDGSLVVSKIEYAER